MSIFKKLWVRLGCTILISENDLNIENEWIKVRFGPHPVH